MTLHVTGVETIEVTDPQGVCNLPDQKQLPPPQTEPIPPNIPPSQPNILPYPPTPGIPGIIDIPLAPLHPYTDRPLPATTRTWPTLHPSTWQPGSTGDPPGAVYQAADGDKWTKNMQLRNAEEDLKAGQPGTEQKNDL